MATVGIDRDLADCLRCGGELEWEECHEGCDDGWWDMHEEDPMAYEPGETEWCLVCQGEGGWLACPRCMGASE